MTLLIVFSWYYTVYKTYVSGRIQSGSCHVGSSYGFDLLDTVEASLVQQFIEVGYKE